MSVRTIALTLAPTAEEVAALERLQTAFNAACNYISEVAWREREFNSVRLHRLVYYEVRARFGLMAQHAVRAIGVVAASYKVDREASHVFRLDAAVCLDTPRLYRISHNRASIATLDGRLKITLNIGGHQRQRLAQATKIAEADLVRDHKGRWRLLVAVHYPDPPMRQAVGVLGIDLGRTDIAATSDGETFSGAQVTAVRNHYADVRAKLQRKAAKGTRSTRRRARQLQRRLSGKERRFQRHVNHTISRRLVENALGTHRALAIEDLTGIRERANKQPRTKVERLHSNRWAFHTLRAFISYKAADAGLPLIVVNPAYTSQTCATCLYIGQRQGKRFACDHCGYTSDADINGACMIALLGLSVMQPRGPWLCCAWPQGSSKPLPQGKGYITRPIL